MPSHPDRVKQNYCNHEFSKTTTKPNIYGSNSIGKICIHCGKFIRLGTEEFLDA